MTKGCRRPQRRFCEAKAGTPYTSAKSQCILATDSEVLDYAARESRVVITLDRDFPQILALTAANRPSVVLIRRQRLRAAELASLVASIWRDHERALEQGCVLKAGSRGMRVHRLPLR